MEKDTFTPKQHEFIIKALKEGEESGMIKDFDWDEHRKRLHKKYLDENGKLKQRTKGEK